MVLTQKCMISDNVRMKFRMAELLLAKLIPVYRNTKQMCLPVQCVYMCFDLTPMLPENRNLYDSFFRFQTSFKDRQQNGDKRLLASSCLSISLSVLPHSTTSFIKDKFSCYLIHIYIQISLIPSCNLKFPEDVKKFKTYLIFSPYYNILLHEKETLCIVVYLK